MANLQSRPCVICGQPIGVDSYGWAGGQNAEPIASGQCCEDCDLAIVTPAQMIPFGYSNEQIAEVQADMLLERGQTD